MPVGSATAAPPLAELAENVSPTLNLNHDGAPIVFEPRYVRNGRGAPDTVCPPLKAQSGQTGKGDAAPVVCFPAEMSGTQRASTEELSPALSVKHTTAVCFKPSHFTRGKDGAPADVTPPLSADADKGDQDTAASEGYQVRRLTPLEAERSQGFPDGYTAILSDTQRYRALGNSMATNVMRWIFERIIERQ